VVRLYIFGYCPDLDIGALPARQRGARCRVRKYKFASRRAQSRVARRYQLAVDVLNIDLRSILLLRIEAVIVFRVDENWGPIDSKAMRSHLVPGAGMLRPR